jgi:hypothetical protein
MGWAGLDNGRLLALASEQFDVFVTVDRNLSFQRNLTGLPMAVVVLRASSNRLVDLVPLVPDLLVAIERPQPRSVTVVSA